jgi:hypothetical protein
LRASVAWRCYDVGSSGSARINCTLRYRDYHFSRRVKLSTSTARHERCEPEYHATMSESTTLIYAELLSNIRQISVIAALDSPSNSSTRAELSSDGQQFLLRHEGQATILELPGAASPSFRLQPPAIAAKELSWRLPLAGEPKAADTESTDAPWPAKDLSESTEFLCRSCGGVIVGKGRVKEWRDLPSENWAEMMDFWHCHKPSVPQPSGSGHSHYDPATSRGYGANTKFCAQSGIAFVDLTALLVAEADCTGVKVRCFLLLRYCCICLNLGGYQEGGQASSAMQWSGHRYKCPRLILEFFSPGYCYQEYPLLGLWVFW